MVKMEEKFLKFYILSGDARELNSVRYPRKNGFFSPAGLGPAFSPKDSTDWEPAAIEKRNPRIRSKNSECELYGGSCAAVKIIEG